MFKLSRTFAATTSGANAQRGFPAPGAGAQTTGAASPQPSEVGWSPRRWLKGSRTWGSGAATPTGGQQGFPAPNGLFQRRPRGSMPNEAPIYGQNIEVWTPYFSRGADAFVQNYGKVLTNPIGAGVVALNRPQASYGPAGQYVNGAIWWTSQAIPTSVNLQGLYTPEALAAVIDSINIQAVVRTTG